MYEIRLQQRADELLRYFEGMDREYPHDHMKQGAELCRRWLALAEKKELTQAEIDVLDAQLRAEPDPGSGWLELSIQFRNWARSKGFRAGE